MRLGKKNCIMFCTNCIMNLLSVKGSPVHVTSACVGSGEGSDRFGILLSVVANLLL
jgi:hypothetical protein